MATRVVAVIVLAAVAVGVAWVALRSHDDPPDPTTTRSAALTPDRPVAPVGTPPILDPATSDAADKPALAVVETPASPQLYATETRDETWAPTTEAEIRRRFKAIRGATLEAAECHETQCQLTVTGSEAQLGKTIADLESERGLHDFADNIFLTAPEARPDGTIVLRAIASFRR